MSDHRHTPHHVVILGGGITGLSAAFHLARKHPAVQITLIEKSTRFGGWVRSERVQVRDSDGNRGSVLLEAGPRTIRPNSKSILELIHLLDLRSEVLSTPRASPAGRNRFLHIAPTPGLQPLPYSLLSALALPLGRLVLKAVLAEPFVSANHDDEGDESVDSFFSRRFGDAFAHTLGSALVHGIYAADSRRLSVRSAFPSLRESEARGNGSVVWGELEEEEAWDTGSTVVVDDREWEARVRAAALFSFREGMETLVGALVGALEGCPNVTLRNCTAARRIDQEGGDGGGPFEVRMPRLLKATHVISALPLPALDAILPQQPSTRSLPHLRANPHSTVIVMNLVFPAATTTTPLHPPGFGYLIPRPEQGYPVAESEHEHEREPGLLGVVFDTASLPEQDDADGATRFVKMSAMIGGPYPLPPARSQSGSSGPDDDRALLAAVLPLISAQLGGPPLPEPLHYAVHRNTESIPTYLVGHTARMRELRRALRERWGGRMKVVGAGVGGVSVADCVKAGRQAAREVGAQIEA
ncbi:hypothetical protein BJV78DRAFT_1126732 [Lactifluus subvellereus]|nr:hypothetical protein BJV78DRAFT_1126732 [Lactifluus subvellereus]